jgi:hypothetical protein
MNRSTFRNTITFSLLSISFTLITCNLQSTEVQVSEEVLNSMSVVLNDSEYVLTNVRAAGGNTVWDVPPSCSGLLLGKTLFITMKVGDSVAVGTTINYMTFTIWYDTNRTINKSGTIASQSYYDGKATRAKGTFYFDALNGKDTLNFRDGRFDAYLQPGDWKPS